MNPSVVLSRSDHQLLCSLLHDESPDPFADSGPEMALRDLLENATITEDETLLAGRVGLGDEVLLISPKNQRDTFKLRIVTPSEADIDRDRIPVSLPIAQAVLGRRLGESVSWMAPVGLRVMRIELLKKCVFEPVG